MTNDEFLGVAKMLRAYWPGEWDEARYAVWLDAMAHLSGPVAVEAVRRMGAVERFPSVAAFNDQLREVNPSRPVEYRRELAAPRSDPEKVKGYFAEARQKLRSGASLKLVDDEIA